MAKKVGNPGIVDTQRQGMTDVPDPAANVAATGKGSPRQAVGDAVYKSINNASGAPSPNTIPEAKKGASKGGNASQLGPTGHRSGVLQERLGPRFAISVALPGPQLHEAGEVQANGRIVPPAVGRSRVNFNAGATSDYP